MLRGPLAYAMNMMAIMAMLVTSGCAMVGVPDPRNVNIPSPTTADARKTAINERPDSVMYLPLGEDVLVPEVLDDEPFPSEMVGPFELRGETLAGALQLILADYDISIAFETQEGLTRRITVANLKGDLGKVVHQVCSLANLYCSYEDGTITVKDTQTFTVTLPPLGSGEGGSEYLDNISAGLAAILGDGAAPIVDPTTRTIVYSATQRTANVATRYFQRLRANTAMIVFETYIWEVSLNAGNSVGIDWTQLESFGKFNTGISLDGTIGADFTSPISIGLPTTGQEFNGQSGDLIEFLSQFGAVKTISQPQITVLSGAEAELRVADTRNYVSQIATTLSEGQATTSVNTDSVDTGFTLTIGSSWDKSTVYANVAIELTDVKQIDNFAFSDDAADDDPDQEATEGSRTRIQLPQTSERQLTTQIRVRPGDSVLIAGLVRENDNFDDEGIGFMKPIIPQSRTAVTNNLELVILLRPRVVVYTAPNDPRYLDYAMKKHKLPGTGVEVTSPKELGVSSEQAKEPNYGNLYDEPATRGPISSSENNNQPGFVPASVQPVSRTSLSAPPTPLTAPSASPQPATPVAPKPVSAAPVLAPKTPPPDALANPGSAESPLIPGKVSKAVAPVNPVSTAPTPPSESLLLPPPLKPVAKAVAPDAMNPISSSSPAPKISEPAPTVSAASPSPSASAEEGNVTPDEDYETYGDYTPDY